MQNMYYVKHKKRLGGNVIMSKMDEQILVVPVNKLFSEGEFYFQGTETNANFVKPIMDNIANNFEVMRRGDAEENPEFKQPIPYALLKRGHEIFVYERLKAGGEQRLHGNLSLGVGGHMNKLYDGATFALTLSDNMYRELAEEIQVIAPVAPEADIVGFINDDTNEVGRVHIGILVVIHLHEEASVIVKETNKLKGSWISLEELKHPEVFDRLENWSKIAVEELTK